MFFTKPQKHSVHEILFSLYSHSTTAALRRQQASSPTSAEKLYQLPNKNDPGGTAAPPGVLGVPYNLVIVTITQNHQYFVLFLCLGTSCCNCVLAMI